MVLLVGRLNAGSDMMRSNGLRACA
jgi:hypothetical protein